MLQALNGSHAMLLDLDTGRIAALPGGCTAIGAGSLAKLASYTGSCVQAHASITRIHACMVYAIHMPDKLIHSHTFVCITVGQMALFLNATPIWQQSQCFSLVCHSLRIVTLSVLQKTAPACQPRLFHCRLRLWDLLGFTASGKATECNTEQLCLAQGGVTFRSWSRVMYLYYILLLFVIRRYWFQLTHERN